MAEAGEVDDGYDNSTDLQPYAEFSAAELQIPETKYEYLDHPADIQLHSWGDTLEEAFEQMGVIKEGALSAVLEISETFPQPILDDNAPCHMASLIAVAMFGYMTEIDKVEILLTQDIEAEGDDMMSLLFHFLDEFLYIFSAEPYFIARKVKILQFDRQNFKIVARGYGEVFDLDKHPQGSEVKAITYSNMQVHENPGKSELFVIVDI